MTATETIAGVLVWHTLEPRPWITPGGNQVCMCGWGGLNFQHHVAQTLVDELGIEVEAIKDTTVAYSVTPENGVVNVRRGPGHRLVSRWVEDR